MIENQRDKRGRLFRKAVESLGLDSPVTEISETLLYDKGNLSKILNNKAQPSTTLIKAFQKAFKVNIEDFDAPNRKTAPDEERFEDLLAAKIMERLLPIINKVLDSHQKILKELLKQGLEIDELLDDVQELKETTHSILKEVKELH